MAKYIYSRVSTDKQDNSNQLEHLTRLYPEAIVYEETVSGAKANKPILEALLVNLKSGDILIVAALDRLGRKAVQALTLIEDLYSRGVAVVSVRENLDYRTMSGKLVSQIMLSVAEMERTIISNRIKQALLAKKLEARRTGNGWKCGRPKFIPNETIELIKALRSQGKTMQEISTLTGVSISYICKLTRKNALSVEVNQTICTT